MPSGETFNNSSLRGTYAFSGTGWGGQGPVAAIGLLTFDGNRAISGLTQQNVPGDRFGERKFLELAVNGTYAVNPNGTGTTRPVDGGDPETLFAITHVDSIGGARIAQEFSFAVRALDPVAGSLITVLATRLPDEETFSNASLRGTYVGASVARGGQTPAAGFGVLRYDGTGGFSESNISNVQAGSFRERTIVTGSDQGVYAVNPNGTGTVANGGVVFVITKAEVVGDVKLALEYAFIVRDVMPTTGSHFTGVTKRRSD